MLRTLCREKKANLIKALEARRLRELERLAAETTLAAVFPEQAYHILRFAATEGSPRTKKDSDSMLQLCVCISSTPLEEA